MKQTDSIIIVLSQALVHETPAKSTKDKTESVELNLGKENEKLEGDMRHFDLSK